MKMRKRKVGRPKTGKNWPKNFHLKLSQEMLEFIIREAQFTKQSSCGLIRSFFPAGWQLRLEALRKS